MTQRLLTAGLEALLAPAALLDLPIGLLAAIPHRAFGWHAERRWDTPPRRRRGLAIVLGGIEGPSLMTRWLALGVLRSGWRGAVVVSHWSAGPPLLRTWRNLASTTHHASEAARLRETLVAYARAQPNRPILLVAQSGGCWIAARALESLAASEPGHTLPPIAALFIAPAISRRHDLRPAAAACAGGLTCVTSRGDWLFLGLAVTLLGNCDRRRGPAVGWLGPRADTRPPVIERHWRPLDLRHGRPGNHTLSAPPGYVASLLREVTAARRGDQ